MSKARPAGHEKQLVGIGRLRDMTSDGMRVNKEFQRALTKKIEILVEDAEARAKANSRATLRPFDL